MSASSSKSITYIYVAGPYSVGDKQKNITTNMAYSSILLDLGFIPFVPLLTHFWDKEFPHNYEFWLAYDLYWLIKCDAVLRTPGTSKGADREIAYAYDYKIPVFYSVRDLILTTRPGSKFVLDLARDMCSECSIPFE